MRWNSALFCLLLCAFVLLTGCACQRAYDDFDPEAEGLVDVQTQYTDDGETVQRQYTLASGGRIRPAEVFAADAAAFYDVPHGCFGSYIDGNRVLNRLAYVDLLDAEGEHVEITADIEGIFQCLEQLEHDLFRIRIIETGGEYFAYVELNVNWWSPCTLYFYNREQQRLVELYRWNGEEVTALHIRSAEGLRAL